MAYHYRAEHFPRKMSGQYTQYQAPQGNTAPSLSPNPATPVVFNGKSPAWSSGLNGSRGVGGNGVNSTTNNNNNNTHFNTTSSSSHPPNTIPNASSPATLLQQRQGGGGEAEKNPRDSSTSVSTATTTTTAVPPVLSLNGDDVSGTTTSNSSTASLPHEFHLWPALHRAVYVNDSRSVRRMLLEEGERDGELSNLVNAADEADGATPLHVAAAQGNYQVAAALVEAGAIVDVQDTEVGTTPLILATQGRAGDIVELLLLAGADPSATDAAGFAPLHFAAHLGDGRAVSQLIGAGAKLNARAPLVGTPLALSVRRGHYDVSWALGAAGADVSAKDHSGLSACMHAAIAGLTDLLSEWAVPVLGGRKGIRGLIADRGPNGETLLHAAAANGHEGVVNLLLSLTEAKAALLNMANGVGETPLIEACKAGSLRVARALCRAGANVGVADRVTRFTALHWAVASGNLELVKDLVDSWGAPVNAADHQGSPPWETAVLLDMADIADYLRPKTAKRFVEDF